ncbi:lysophospholipid acyltransferase family protein [Craterilacuibacter sp. RT1T]|uniref:lysophospholipid acyltransferase family protein n=1 Tax=Craterilacuibacter sp. RT1T TaxID=2942211 RepID=UPI0020BDB7DA|nr:lysophospholipid acyltransferase family protein [Craterilacuibacter sp. RT1T]MCL6262913.1 lysophospholipid acyltransferase family protein [Craterilacuibacter sp. RT1T]
MHNTIFTTPVIRTLMAWLSILLLKLSGWKINGNFPAIPKYVMIAAPHTSNWDFPVTLAVCFAKGAQIYWMGKHSLFKGPMGPVMRWLGGIPVNRNRNNSLVQQIVDVYHASDRLVVIIPPEGTRAKVTEWKTGFYHIAKGAGVPVVPAYLDFSHKQAGIMEPFYLGEDLDTDMAKIRALFDGINGKRPDSF